MQTIALLTILATVVIANRVLAEEIKGLKTQVKFLEEMSRCKHTDIKLESIEIAQEQLLQINNEIGNSVEELREEIEQLGHQELNTREIMMDKTEEIKHHITKEKKDLHFKFVNTPIKAVIMDGTSKKANV